MRSHLLEGTVRHRRSHPFTYALEHGVYYFALDLAELDEVARRLRLVGRNRRNVLTFRDADHLPTPATDLRSDFLAHLRSVGVDPAGWTVTLVTSLRVFGYVFNPASFFLCRDERGGLRVVVVEVHNTFGERHLYTLHAAQQDGAFVASMDKELFVSPFISMDARYAVHVRDDASSLRIAINEREGGEPLLSASLVLRRRRLTNRTLLKILIRYPLVTHKTIAAIHWHALRLWLKGARFLRHSEHARGHGLVRDGDVGR
ncbi:MAG TPA: DUF1365 domain-containing protein [Desulfobacterales bacterium]|nr:DUF1365 domain-containing protein [Desulfobacterales bacterium]